MDWHAWQIRAGFGPVRIMKPPFLITPLNQAGPQTRRVQQKSRLSSRHTCLAIYALSESKVITGGGGG